MQNRLVLLLLLFSLATQAQVSEGGLPPSFQPDYQAALSGKMPNSLNLPSLDVAAALGQDSHTPGQTRFAAPVTANVSLENAGTWQVLPNGDRVWLCALRSPGAKGLTVLFEQFNLPAGAKFFAYNSAQKVLGAYTARSCLPSGKFLVGVLQGETVYLELYEPAAVQGQSQLLIQRVDVVYNWELMNDTEGFGSGLACNVNINCPDGANWQTAKKGIARILMVFSGGEAWCSGTLIANTANSFEPYFLTAHHCQLILPNPDFALWRFDFDYESATCPNPGTEPVAHSILGSTRVSFRAETDFMLLKINPIPPSYELYFNGWNRDDNATTIAPNSVLIHHPQGDIKKIYVDKQAATIHPTTLDWGAGFGISPVNSHWKSIPDVGIFQPGSSGGPFFDANQRVVGQLHGGAWNDNNPCTVFSAFFGRFNLSWAQGTTPAARLKDWLDPVNTNPTTQNGYLKPVIQAFTLSGTVKTHWDAPIEGVRVDISGGITASTITDSLGRYQFLNVPAAGNYTLKAQLDNNDLNGVTTFDLVLISKHILGLEPLDSPWKIIAADINTSSSVTTFDIVEARKVILGLNPGFPANTSWRFFPASTTFGNPNNPFSGGLPTENITINNLQNTQIDLNFKGVKVGDLNNTAVGN